jgi:hypothetical protein
MRKKVVSFIKDWQVIIGAVVIISLFLLKWAPLPEKVEAMEAKNGSQDESIESNKDAVASFASNMNAYIKEQRVISEERKEAQQDINKTQAENVRMLIKLHIENGIQ